MNSDLLNWRPAAGKFPEDVSITTLKRQARDQGLNLSKASLLLRLMENLVPGGFGERPGEHMRHSQRKLSFSSNERFGEKSAIARVKWLHSLGRMLEKSKKDPELEEACANLAFRLTTLVRLWDIDHSRRGQAAIADFERWLWTFRPQNELNFEQPHRLDHLWDWVNVHQSELDAGVIWAQEYPEKGCLFLPPRPSSLLASVIAGDAADGARPLPPGVTRSPPHRPSVLLEAGPNGHRRIWDWIELLTRFEQPADPASPGSIFNPSQVLLDSKLNQRGEQIWEFVWDIRPDPVLDRPASELLTRLMVNNNRGLAIKETDTREKVVRLWSQWWVQAETHSQLAPVSPVQVQAVARIYPETVHAMEAIGRQARATLSQPSSDRPRRRAPRS